MAGTILFATISKSVTGKYFVAITCEAEHPVMVKVATEVGIDLGLTDLAVLSNGKKYENIRNTKKYERKLTYEQRQLSKKVKRFGKQTKTED